MQKLLFLVLLLQLGCSATTPKEDRTVANVETNVILEFPDIYYKGTMLNAGTWPETVTEAVNAVLSTMTEKDKSVVGEMTEENLILLHHGFGTGLRNSLGLWRGNDKLLLDCNKTHPDDCSLVIIVALWAKLKSA